MAQPIRLRANKNNLTSYTYELFIIPWMKANPEARVLDFGAGQMDYVQHLKKQGFNIKGYEPFFRKKGKLAIDLETILEHVAAVCEGYRICRAAKLLMSLGYGNFVNVIQYDTYAMAEAFIAAGNKWDLSKFSSSSYGLDFSKYESSQILNSPNLSLFPLLAYHKICNDHYRNEKWQSFEPWTCNIDYLLPTSNMNASSFISADTFTSAMTSILDLENSNLPIDYFTSS